MKQQTSKEDKMKNSRETLNSLCSVSALLLSVACCMALIHVELRIQEHHRLISHSVTFCDQMETQILRKVQQNYERWQVTKADGLKGHLQGTNGKETFIKFSGFWYYNQLASNPGDYENNPCLTYWRALSSKFVPTTRLESTIRAQAYNRWGCQEQGNTKANQRKDILNTKKQSVLS